MIAYLPSFGIVSWHNRSFFIDFWTLCMTACRSSSWCCLPPDHIQFSFVRQLNRGKCLSFMQRFKNISGWILSFILDGLFLFTVTHRVSQGPSSLAGRTSTPIFSPLYYETPETIVWLFNLLKVILYFFSWLLALRMHGLVVSKYLKRKLWSEYQALFLGGGDFYLYESLGWLGRPDLSFLSPQ